MAAIKLICFYHPCRAEAMVRPEEFRQVSEYHKTCQGWLVLIDAKPSKGGYTLGQCPVHAAKLFKLIILGNSAAVKKVRWSISQEKII